MSTIKKPLSRPSAGIAKPRERYHHGDLRAALLTAGEAELAEKGIEGFSLRGVARRAGVSHAAPAHHFKDVNELLTALAAGGLRRLLTLQLQRQRKAPDDAMSQLVAAALGYIDYALANPALFRLTFSSDRPDRQDPALAAAARCTYDHLVACVRRLHGNAADSAEPSPRMIMTAWAVSHGLADLLNGSRAKLFESLDRRDREALLTAIIRGAVAGG